MTRRTAWPVLSVALLCGAAAFAGDSRPAQLERKPVEIRVVPPEKPGANARVKTSVGTFEVNEKNVDLLRKTIAGEQIPGVQIWAGGAD